VLSEAWKECCCELEESWASFGRVGGLVLMYFLQEILRWGYKIRARPEPWCVEGLWVGVAFSKKNCKKWIEKFGLSWKIAFSGGDLGQSTQKSRWSESINSNWLVEKAEILRECFSGVALLRFVCYLFWFIGWALRKVFFFLLEAVLFIFLINTLGDFRLFLKIDRIC